jgi:hypothetical protein
MTTSDKQFDSQFDKVENLVHYPWIGCNYASAPKRVLIMGDSHYTVNDEGEFCPEEYDRCVTDKEYTRGIINCAIEEGSWKFHTNLQKTFLDENDMDVEGFWNKIASYNFIQEPMKGTHEVPSLADYETAWKCLADVVQIIKPDICIFVGLRNDKGMNILDEKCVKYFIQTLDEKINNSYPKKGELQFANGYKLPFYMIHHTSLGYSPQLWYDFLNKEIPEVVSFLDK